ncbi:hypothetical protein KPL44_23785 [Clostridium sp. DSM 17811]|uniref:hypothetical protein n=1 Tax=Clostridium sp. DSM 17811 TaxID=2843317 RepID=UPI001C0B94A0|nr:hypothetical protein [Clostridium sp. DSM 17811]MBU3102264.1 hypothetical protein [Clostridium sp. DSM 17811]
MNKLTQESNSYIINSKKPFNPISRFNPVSLKESFDFAYDMSFGRVGEHRDHRTGGSHKRENGEIFINTFQGKLAEFSIYEIFKSHGMDIPKPDLEKYDLGAWDTCDFDIDGIKLAVKSTKHFGQLLLLETKDWNNKGEYLPNKDSDNDTYNYFILVRISPEGDSLMKRHRLWYSKDINRDQLEDIISNENWTYDSPGYISNMELVEIINNQFILPKGSMLNGKTKMDAENYYIQAGDMHDINGLFKK